jgi:hypothetical protein
MTVSERFTDEPAPMKALPKINVPPPASGAEESSAVLDAEPRASRLLPGRPKTAIHWDARFGLSLIALLVIVNLSLVLLFAKPAKETLRYGPEQSIAKQASPDRLPVLAPASGPVASPANPRRTTTYISSSERKALLDQLNRTRQPGVVSLPPASPAP